MPQDQVGTFRCECCGHTFPRAISDAEALKETARLGLATPGDELVAVCEGCYQRMRRAGVFPS